MGRKFVSNHACPSKSPRWAQEFIATNPDSSSDEGNGAAFARYYDLDVADERDDINLYLSAASASDGPILELACGSGRVCIPLAGAGHEVTGVDRDADMLARATAQWQDRKSHTPSGRNGSLRLVRGDITTIRLGRRFDLVILAFNSLLLLDGEAGRRAALATIREHLTPDGRAMLDVWQPSPSDLELYDGRVINDWVKVDPETGESVAKSTVATYDESTRSATIGTRYEVSRGEERILRLDRTDRISFVSRHELLHEMEAEGLQVQSDLGADGSAGTAREGDRLTVIAALTVHPLHTTGTN